MIIMGAEYRQLIKTLTNAKELIFNGHIKEGLDIIEKTVTPNNIKESNWVICNIIDAGNCNAVVSVLDSIGKMFDITACGNIKRVIKCYASVGKYGEFVDIAIDTLVSKGRKDQLDKILPDVGNNGKILLKLAQAYSKLKDQKKANELLRKACENGEKEGCENINQISTSFS